MKKIAFLTCITMFSGAAIAGSESNSQYFDQAKVLSVAPQLERVNSPIRECRTEYEQVSSSRPSAAGSIIGGIAGGLLGSTIGRGNGRVAAAAVGAGVGAVVGDRIDNDTQTVTRPVEHCTYVDNWQTIQRGYLVSYVYNGKTFTTVTTTPPKDTIEISVSVAPISSEVVSYSPPIIQRWEPMGHPPPGRP